MASVTIDENQPRLLTDNHLTLLEQQQEEEIHRRVRLRMDSAPQSACASYPKLLCFDDLPKDIQTEILCWLSLDDLGQARLVSRHWKKLVANPGIWLSLYKRNFDTNKKFETDKDRIFWAVKVNKAPIIAYLLKRDPSLLGITDPVGGFTPLYRAAQKGSLDAVKLLVKKGADIESTKGDGSTPFYISCQENNLEVAKFLISQKCNIECTFLAGFTPLYISAEMGHVDIIKLLLENRANVNASAERGATPLYIACQNGHSKVVEALIEHGALIECVFNDCYKPIYIANSRNHKEVVEVLKRHGADVGGLTPIN